MDHGDDDAIGAALQTRRIPHGRSGKVRGKGGGGGGASTPAVFDPLRALGHYEVDIGTPSRKNGERHSDGSQSWLEIHQLTPCEDGLLGTFTIANNLQGICVLAGSRKGLASIIEDLENDHSRLSGESDDESDEGQSTKAESQTSEPLAVEQRDVDQESQKEDEDEEDEEQPRNDIELADERINKRARAFEKNSFRNPKFWLQYKAQVHAAAEVQGPSHDASDQAVTESDRGYIVFANNACQSFEGTISARSLGWKNLKFVGRKVRPHATACPLTWTGFDIPEVEGKVDADDAGGD
jgi:hypothetical protein